MSNPLSSRGRAAEPGTQTPQRRRIERRTWCALVIGRGVRVPGPRSARRGMTGVLSSLAALLLAQPAQAVVGGRPDEGALKSRTVMVLSSRGGVCTGVVASPRAVLTAAHCVAGADEHRVHWRGEDGSPALVTPAAKAVHPGYDRGAVEGRRRSIDLALVRLAEPLPPRFRPASLQAAPEPKDAPIRLLGYGAATPGDPRSTGVFRAAELTVTEPYGPSRILVWARGPRGVGACQGDSGGPIAAGDRVFAVATWTAGPGPDRCGGLAQGVLLGPQRDWIDRTLAGWGERAEWR